jgi:hypothetical protein
MGFRSGQPDTGEFTRGMAERPHQLASLNDARGRDPCKWQTYARHLQRNALKRAGRTKEKNSSREIIQ